MKINLNQLHEDFTNFSVLTDRKFENLEEIIRDIKDNHLEHLNSDMSELKTDVKWLKKGYDSLNAKFWGVIAGVAATLAVTILQIILNS